jgi:hypothetical protein
MKRISIFIILLFFAATTFAQQVEKDVFAFPITDYIVNSNDSVSIIQVEIPTPSIKIDEKQLGLLKHNFSNNKEDTANIGFGRCNLIKGSNYYFGIRLKNVFIKPMKNDLIYTKIIYPSKYKGQIYNLIKNAIYFVHVTGEKFFVFESAFSIDKTEENNLIDALVADIKYTGQEMQKKSDSQDTIIEGGLFNGKKLFVTMQSITAENVKDFIDYVIARPTKYAGNTWKIAEVFATWAISGTPRVIK